jgi:hypothetical protein
VIPTQSADVERGFSLLNHALGLNRLSTQICTLDCRLRVKQALPAAFTNAHEAAEVEMQLAKIRADPETTISVEFVPSDNKKQQIQKQVASKSML